MLTLHVDEITRLNLALQASASRLERNNATLEERVRERTDELAQKNESLQAEIHEHQRAEEQIKSQLAQLQRWHNFSAGTMSRWTARTACKNSNVKSTDSAAASANHGAISARKPTCRIPRPPSWLEAQKKIRHAKDRRHQQPGGKYREPGLDHNVAHCCPCWPRSGWLARLREVFETIYDTNHPLRGALFNLGSLETVRIIEAHRSGVEGGTGESGLRATSVGRPHSSDGLGH